MTPENEQPLSVEQAGNKLREDEKTAPARIKAEAAGQDISLALEPDRRRYLAYAISLLDTVDGELMRHLPENIRMKYSGQEMAMLFKGLLRAKVAGQSNRHIAKALGVPLNVIDNLEMLAIEATKRAIARKRKTGVPILGGA